MFKHLITILFQSILQMWRESEKYSIAIKLSNSNAAWAGSQLDDAQNAVLNNIAKLIGTKAENLNNLNLLKISMYKICIVRHLLDRSTTDKSLQP